MDITKKIDEIQKLLHNVIDLLHLLTAEKEQTMKRSITDCEAELHRMSGSYDFVKNLTNVAGVLTDAVSVLKMLKSTKNPDPFTILCGAMKVFSSVATIVSGPLGSAFAAVGQILSAIFSLFKVDSQEECSLSLQVHRIVTRALHEFGMEQLSHRVKGWSAVAREMICELEHQQASSSYSRFNPERFDIFVELMGELSSRVTPTIPYDMTAQCVLTVCSKSPIADYLSKVYYISELASSDVQHNNIDEMMKYVVATCALDSHPITSAQQFEKYNDCVPCMYLYAYIAMHYYMILTWNLALSRCPEEIKMIENKLNCSKQAARDLLGFLSDKHLLSSFEGLIDGKLLVMEAYLCNARVVQYVETFRREIGLPATEYTLKDIQMAAVKLSLFSDLNLNFGSCYRITDQGGNHFIRIINMTRWPINIFCGEGGDHTKDVHFHTILKSHMHRSYPLRFTHSEFSIGGIFCIDNDHANSVDEVKEGSIISFAVSNNSTSGQQIKIVVTNSITSKCLALNNLQAADGSNKAKYFTHKGQVCFIKGIMTIRENNCCNWNFCIEEFDQEKLQQRLITGVPKFSARHESKSAECSIS